MTLHASGPSAALRACGHICAPRIQRTRRGRGVCAVTHRGPLSVLEPVVKASQRTDQFEWSGLPCLIAGASHSPRIKGPAMQNSTMDQIEAAAEIKKLLQPDLDMSDGRPSVSRPLEIAVSARRGWVVPALTEAGIGH